MGIAICLSHMYTCSFQSIFLGHAGLSAYLALHEEAIDGEAGWERAHSMVVSRDVKSQSSSRPLNLIRLPEPFQGIVYAEEFNEYHLLHTSVLTYQDVYKFSKTQLE
jgi:hypothetical protein